MNENHVNICGRDLFEKINLKIQHLSDKDSQKFSEFTPATVTGNSMSLQAVGCGLLQEKEDMSTNDNKWLRRLQVQPTNKDD